MGLSLKEAIELDESTIDTIHFFIWEPYLDWLNENEEIPTKSDLLSDKNSRARNEKILENISDQPATDGNVPIPNLSRPYSAPAFTQNKPVKKFSRESLTGERVSYSSAEEVAAEQQSQASDGTNNVFKQEEFSADELKNISLSTYQWAWAPYINEFKRKLFRVWYAPPAYYQLGLIYGYTVIRFTIDRNGNILDKQILKHEGHSSLEQSSSNAIDAVFPLKPLPAHFPDETLTLTIQMIYPNLRPGSN
jgi:outer membrane biosynthesis protein TonB